MICTGNENVVVPALPSTPLTLPMDTSMGSLALAPSVWKIRPWPRSRLTVARGSAPLMLAGWMLTKKSLVDDVVAALLMVTVRKVRVWPAKMVTCEGGTAT